MSLTFLYTQDLEINHLQALTNCKAVSVSAAGTTTSTTYVDTPGSSSLSFTKIDNVSKLRVDFHASFYTTSSLDFVGFGVRINSTDYDVHFFTALAANIHNQISRTVLIPSISAGTYTVQGRWKVTGSGTLTMTTNSQISFALSEVQE